jgi:hypothetical protein
MRTMQACAAGLAMVLGGAAGCQIVAGISGNATLGNPNGSGGGAASSSSSASRSSSASSSSSSGGPAVCASPPCAFGQGCTTDAGCMTGYCNPTTMTCDATTIVAGLENPNSLAADANGFYWADGDLGAVLELDVGTTTPVELIGGLTGPQGLILAPAGLLHWVEPAAGNVDARAPGDTTSPLDPEVVGQAFPVALAAPFASGPDFFWVTQGTSTVPGDVSVYVFTAQDCMSGAGSGSKIAAMATGTQGSYTLVFATDLNQGSLFTWSFSGTGSVLCPSGQPTVLYNGLIAGIAMDATSAYWTSGANVFTVPLTGGTPMPLASDQPVPADIAVDGTNVYWIDQGTAPGTGAVMTVPLAGGAKPVVLASAQTTPKALLLFMNNVYWIAGAPGQGAVKTVPK